MQYDCTDTAHNPDFTVTEEITWMRACRSRPSIRCWCRWDGKIRRRTVRSDDLEPHPAGRWFRDLGGNKRSSLGLRAEHQTPTLLEIWGPLFMSPPRQPRIALPLAQTPDGTVISLRPQL